MRETLPDGCSRPWRPFHRLTARRAAIAAAQAGFYHLARRPTAAPLTGTEVFLAPHDPEFDADSPSGTVLSVDALCLNRDLPVGPAIRRRPPGDCGWRSRCRAWPSFPA